jgi:hypothetical protein
VTYDDLMDEYGGCTAAARALSLSKQTVNNWRHAGIPDDQQLVIQKKNPRLRADASIVRKYRSLLGGKAA